MDYTAIQTVIATVGSTAATGIDALVPVGTALAGSFIVLSIVMLGASLMTGGTFLAPIVSMCGVSAAVMWIIRSWPELVLGTAAWTRHIIGLVIPGYAGPQTLLQMAVDI